MPPNSLKDILLSFFLGLKKKIIVNPVKNNITVVRAFTIADSSKKRDAIKYLRDLVKPKYNVISDKIVCTTGVAKPR